MDVAAYLTELLTQNKHVFVPGLGTFSIRKTAVNYQQHEFSPPKNWIEFLAEDKIDDTLINYIIAQKSISQQASGYFVEKFVDQLKREAHTKNIPVKEALFPTNETSDTVFNQENFGLPTISLSEVKKAPPVEEQTLQTEREALPEKDYVENFYREFSSNLSEEEIKPKSNAGFWGSIVLLLAICCLGIYALYLYYPSIFKGILPQNKPDIVLAKPTAADTLTRLPATTQPKTQNDTVARVTADTLVTPVKTVAAPQKTKNDTVKIADADMVAKSPYEIIGASFKTLKGAKTFLSQLQSQGMRHAKILNNTAGKQVLITFGSYPDKPSALNALKKIRVKDAHSEAYIQHYLK